MNLSRRTFLHLAAGAALPAVSRFAWAQAYPTRTVNIILAFPPGGPNEGVVRFLAEKLTSSLGQAVIIENRPGGAGGTVGTRSVANAAPDGHTLLSARYCPAHLQECRLRSGQSFYSDHGPLQHPANVGR